MKPLVNVATVQRAGNAGVRPAMARRTDAHRWDARTRCSSAGRSRRSPGGTFVRVIMVRGTVVVMVFVHRFPAVRFRFPLERKVYRRPVGEIMGSWYGRDVILYSFILAHRLVRLLLTDVATSGTARTRVKDWIVLRVPVVLARYVEARSTFALFRQIAKIHERRGARLSAGRRRWRLRSRTHAKGRAGSRGRVVRAEPARRRHRRW